MRRIEILIIVFFLGISELVGQTENKKLVKADDFFTHGYFSAALPIYLDLLKSDPFNSNLNYKTGICYLNSRSQKTKAVDYLEKTISPLNNCNAGKSIAINQFQNVNLNGPNDSYNSERKGTKQKTLEATVPINAFRYLGDAYKLIYEFDMAISCYEKVRDNIVDITENNQCIKEDLDEEIELCNFGRELYGLLASPLNLKTEKIRKNINSTNSYFSPFSFTDEPILIFTSYIPLITRQKLTEDELYFSDKYIPHSQDSLKRANLVNPLNITTISSKDSAKNNAKKEATIGTSVDGQFVLIYMDEKGDGNLYMTCLKENIWTLPEKLNKTSNTGGWEANECISADGKSMYFTSDREGGYGGKDIYKSVKLANGKWAKAMNLGPTINTPYDDEAPFIYPDGSTLYFSSNGHNKIPSFDIFTSTLSDSGAWTKPINVGYPVNIKEEDHSAADDKELTIEKTNYPSTIEKEIDEKNNYIITFFNDYKVPMTIIKGKILDLSGKVINDTKITVADNETEYISGQYYQNNKTGDYLLILPSGKNNNITYEGEGYIFQSEQIDISKETNYYKIHKIVQMVSDTKGAKVILNNIFFDFDKATLLSVSNIELKRLFQFLSDNPNMIVEISDYIYSKENIKYNKKLALDRAQEVINYLILKGINKERIIGKGRVVSKLKVTNIKKENVEYSIDEPLNQWLELKILKIISK